MPANSPANSYVALLRGINVGGKNKLPMKDLAGYFTEAGCTGVRTYIQSGNVIFRADRKAYKGLGETISLRIEQQFGYKIPVVIRTAQEVADAITHNPFLKPDADENAHYLMFLAAEPAPEAVAGLDAARSPGDDFHVRGRDVYMYLRNGAGETKLTNAWFDKQLKTVSTARNWRTVLKLHELLIENDGA